MAYMSVSVFCILNKLVPIFMVCIWNTFPDIIKLPLRFVVGHFCWSWKPLWGEAFWKKQNKTEFQMGLTISYNHL